MSRAELWKCRAGKYLPWLNVFRCLFQTAQFKDSKQVKIKLELLK
jgi:hypothetical protein